MEVILSSKAEIWWYCSILDGSRDIIMCCLSLLHLPGFVQWPDKAVCSSCAAFFQWDASTSASLSGHRAAPACALCWCGPCGLQKDESHRTVLKCYQLKTSWLESPQGQQLKSVSSSFAEAGRPYVRGREGEREEKKRKKKEQLHRNSCPSKGIFLTVSVSLFLHFPVAQILSFCPFLKADFSGFASKATKTITMCLPCRLLSWGDKPGGVQLRTAIDPKSSSLLAGVLK